MKKFLYGFLCTTCVCLLFFTACSNRPSDNGTKTNNVAITDSAVFLDCFDSYVLDVELTDTEGVAWSSSDPEIVSVDETGKLVSYANTGKATITAKSGKFFDTCEVSVVVKSGIPVLNVANRIMVPEGGSYTVSATVFYNGKDITDYVEFGFNAVDENQQIVSAAMASGNSITFTGISADSEVGSKTDYVVYANVFGQLYAEKVEIEVKNAEISYLVKGAVGNELQLKKGVRAFVSDVEIFDRGVKVPTTALSWRIENEAVVTIGNDGALVSGDEGITTLSTTYRGERITVSIRVIKEREYINLQDRLDVDLDMGIGATDSVSGVRILTVNERATSRLVLSGTDKDYGKIIGAACDGDVLEADKFSLENGTATVYVSAFGAARYGEKTLVLKTETKEIIYEFTVPVLLITKSIATKRELEAAIVVKNNAGVPETIYGYYALTQDIDFGGAKMGSGYANDWKYEHGFRGTLDGRGHAIENYLTSMYGLTAQIGQGAVIKNIRFEDIIHYGDTNTLIARGMGGARVENITVTLTSASTPEEGSDSNSGLVAYASVGNVYRNVTINARGKTIFCLFGKEPDTANTVYDNVIVNASAVTYYSKVNTVKPEGVVLNTRN